MASADLKLWRERLMWAKRIWDEKGIIGTGPSTMRMLMEFYRSNQWQGNHGWGGLGASQLRIVNKIFPTANAQQATIAARNPRMQYFARNKESEITAPVAQALHNYDIREANHIDVFNSALRDHQFAPFGVVRHGYTPQDEIESIRGDRVRRIEMFRPANPNRPWIRRVAPWNVLMDPNSERFHMDGGMRWVAFRDVVNVKNLMRNPNITIGKEKLRNFQGDIDSDWMKMRDPELQRNDDPDADKWLEMWSVYEIETRTWFQLTIDESLDDFIRKPDEWPIPWEWLPVNVFAVNEQMDTPFALSLIEDLIPLQIELNQVRTLIHQAVLRTRRINLVGDAVDEEVLQNMQDADMGEWFKVNGVDARTAVHTIQSGGLDPSAITHMSVIQDDMRESSGQSRMDRAQRINVESAAEATFVQSGSDIQDSRIEERFTRFVRETEGLYMQGRRFILSRIPGAREPIQVVGADRASELSQFVNVGAREIQGEFNFEVESGSTRRKDRAVEAQLAQADLSLALSIPEIANVALLWRNYVRARGLDPAEATNPGAHQAAFIRGAASLRDQVVGEPGRTNGSGAPEQAGVDPNLANLLSGGRPNADS